MIRNRLLLLVPTAVVFATVVGGTAAMVGTENRSCARTTVNLTSEDGDSSNVDIVVLVNGSSSASISQQVVQSNGRSRVNIDVGLGDESVTISGETVENGSLVLNVTRNGTVWNESVVVNGSDDRALVFHIDRNGDIRVSREENSSGCLCDAGPAESGVNVDLDGIQIDTGGGVEVNIDNVDRDDDDTDYETDGGRNVGCSASAPCACSDSSPEISSPVRRPSNSIGTNVDVMRAVVRISDFVGLATPGRTADCARAATDVIDSHYGREDSSG